MPNSLRSRLKNLVYKGVLSQKDLDRIVIVPVDGIGDMISRRAVINKVFESRKNFNNEFDQGFFADKVMDLPPVSVSEKVGWWIPVSEMLPEDGTYLVTVERITGKPRIETKSFAKDLNRVDDYDFPKHKCGWYDYDSEYGYWEDTNVIAWMPLPQPYEPQESEDKK